MSVYLVKVTEQYRCDSEAEAMQLIESAKKNADYTVSKTSNEVRTIKAKGEVVDEWKRVTITKEFNEEKEPYNQVMPSYVEDYDE